jgi:RNA polymerase sigma-70 factor (ECF subfamily)
MIDQDLENRIRAGDESAFDTVFRAHYADLVRMAESVVRERALAEEIAQDVMLEVWRRSEPIRLEQGFRAYLLRATRNRALNHIRHERIVQREQLAAAVESPTAPPPDQDLLGAELHDAIEQAMAALPNNCREVFQMSRTQNLRYSEIAAVLDVSVKTVEKRMGQALAELRKSLAMWIPATARKNSS